MSRDCANGRDFLWRNFGFLNVNMKSRNEIPMYLFIFFFWYSLALTILVIIIDLTRLSINSSENVEIGHGICMQVLPFQVNIVTTFRNLVRRLERVECSITEHHYRNCILTCFIFVLHIHANRDLSLAMKCRNSCQT